MALIQWSSIFSVNVAEIDKQHQKLIALINNLNDAMKQGKGKDILAEIIDELSNYAANHFAFEEKYFDKFGYPAAASHKLEHTNFVKKVSEFKNGFDCGQLALTIEVLHRQVKTSRFVMPDLIRHPVFSMDSGFRRNDGNSALLLPK
jgi:hemerythrin